MPGGWQDCAQSVESLRRSVTPLGRHCRVLVGSHNFVGAVGIGQAMLVANWLFFWKEPDREIGPLPGFSFFIDLS